MTKVYNAKDHLELASVMHAAITLVTTSFSLGYFSAENSDVLHLAKSQTETIHLATSRVLAEALGDCDLNAKESAHLTAMATHVVKFCQQIVAGITDEAIVATIGYLIVAINKHTGDVL